MSVSDSILSNIYFCGKTNLMSSDSILPNICFCGRKNLMALDFILPNIYFCGRTKIWCRWIPFSQIFTNIAEWNLVASDPICSSLSNIYFYGRIKYGMTQFYSSKYLFLWQNTIFQLQIPFFQLFTSVAEQNLMLSDSIFQIFTSVEELNLAALDSILSTIYFCGRIKSDGLKYNSFKYLLLCQN
jgi:hypothetical protein